MATNTSFNPQAISDFEKSKLSLNITGVHSAFTAGTVTNLDLALTDDVLLTGGSVLAKGTNIGDSLTLQVIDLNNVMGYGANAVLSQFVTNWYVATDSERQIDLSIDYPAKVIAGLFLRLKFNSTGSTGGFISANYFLHKVMV